MMEESHEINVIITTSEMKEDYPKHIFTFSKLKKKNFIKNGTARFSCIIFKIYLENAVTFQRLTSFFAHDLFLN